MRQSFVKTKKTTNVFNMSSAFNPNMHTSLSDIIKIEDRTMCFYNTNNTVITMVDLVTRKNLGTSYNGNCIWCKHPFSSAPLGCPIDVLTSKITETWTTTDNTYTPEKILYISDSCINDYNKYKEDMLSINNKGKLSTSLIATKKKGYITIKIFCSFNCVQSHINHELKHNNFMYINSSYLLTHMYKDYTGDFPDEPINPAPHWELLDVYLGTLSIVDFRKSFLTAKYINTGNLCYPVGEIYTEHVVF